MKHTSLSVVMETAKWCQNGGVVTSTSLQSNVTARSEGRLRGQNYYAKTTGRRTSPKSGRSLTDYPNIPLCKRMPPVLAKLDVEERISPEYGSLCYCCIRHITALLSQSIRDKQSGDHMIGSLALYLDNSKGNSVYWPQVNVYQHVLSFLYKNSVRRKAAPSVSLRNSVCTMQYKHVDEKVLKSI